MNNILVLEEALLDKSIDGVCNYLADIDRKSGNLAIEKAGEEFGFETIEISGVGYTHLSSAASILGYSSTSGLWNLMSTYQIQTPKIGWFTHEVKTKIRKTFKLSEKDSQATLLPWEGFLVAGMNGQNEEAKKVKVYLLRMERIARSTLYIDKDDFKRASILTKLIGAVGKTTDEVYQEILRDEIERISGRKLPEPAQLKLPLN